MFLRICLFLFLSSFSFPAFSGPSDSCSKIFSKNNQTPPRLKMPNHFLSIGFELSHPGGISAGDVVAKVLAYLQKKGLKVTEEKDSFSKSTVVHVEKMERGGITPLGFWILKRDGELEGRDISQGHHFLKVITPLSERKEDRDWIYSVIEYLETDCQLCNYKMTGFSVSMNTDEPIKTLTLEDESNMKKIIAIVEKSMSRYFQANSQRHISYYNTRPASVSPSKKEEGSHQNPELEDSNVISLFEGGLKSKVRLEGALSRSSVREGYNVISFESSNSERISEMEEDIGIINKSSLWSGHITEAMRTFDMSVFNGSLNSWDLEFFVNFSNSLFLAIQNQEPKLVEFIKNQKDYSKAELKNYKTATATEIVQFVNNQKNKTSSDVFDLFEVLGVEPSLSNQ